MAGRVTHPREGADGYLSKSVFYLKGGCDALLCMVKKNAEETATSL